MSRVFGAIPNIPVGSLFRNRQEVAEAGVHRPRQAGISGAGKEGADSVVLSGGYEDDQDHGDVVIYTGHGGNDPNTGRQIADQELTRGNLALARNQTEGLEVRLIRGSKLDSPFAPADGFRYDGLYFVDDHWHERGRARFLVWRFRLRLADQTRPPTRSGRSLPAARQQVTSSRVIRDSALIRRVKRLHDYSCQVCGVRLVSPAGPYAEGAHIRPLGKPHNGPDEEGNVLCLCPNHHALFDLGAFTINDDFTLSGMVEGTLRTVQRHAIDFPQLLYRRTQYGLT